jgi:nitronate monooxygenase
VVCRSNSTDAKRRGDEMAICTPVCDLFGIEHPVLLAPMAGISGGALAAAVSRAGGLGLIGGGYGDADWLSRAFDAAGDARIGVGFVTWSLARQPYLLDLALERAPCALMLSFGDFRPFHAKVKQRQTKLILQVQTLAQANEAVDAGVDGIVVQGTEAGGHGGARATMPFVPAVVDIAQDIPVIAAGGIADGRGMAAALALGAAGVLCGTGFFASAESLASDNAKQAAVCGSGDDTERSSVFDLVRGLDWPPGWNIRALRNSLTRRWSADIEGLRQNLVAEQARFKAASAVDDTDVAAVIVGEAADLIRAMEPAEDILHAMVSQAEDHIRRMSRLIDPNTKGSRR